MLIRFFDTHAHLNFNTFKDERGEIIKKCLDKNVWVVNIGSQYDTSKIAVEIAGKYGKGIYAAVGIHPIHLSKTEVDEEEIYFRSREESFDSKKYKNLLTEKVVAVGEIGLDYFHIPESRDFDEIKKVQKDGFVAQLNFAKENNLPVVLHCRGAKEKPLEAYNDMVDIVGDFVVNSKSENSIKHRRISIFDAQKGHSVSAGHQVSNTQNSINGVIHCFGANLEIARKFIDLGFYIGFTGIVTFKNAKELQEVAKNIPLEKILAETDCPYLAPDPFRGKRNEPLYVEYVVRKIAELKGVDVEEVAGVIFENSRRVFGV